VAMSSSTANEPAEPRHIVAGVCGFRSRVLSCSNVTTAALSLFAPGISGKRSVVVKRLRSWKSLPPFWPLPPRVFAAQIETNGEGGRRRSCRSSTGSRS